MKVNIKNISNNSLPEYATDGAAGLDVRAFLHENEVLQPLERKLISTGLFMEIPSGYEAQIRPRSGLAFKQGITCLNTPGTIDSDYRGELKVLLINISNSEQTIVNGDRIAQIVFNKIERVEFFEVESLTTSSRGEGGFGHTGIK